MTLRPEHIEEALNKKTFDEIDPDEVLKHYGYKPEEVHCNGVGIGVWRKEEAFQKLGDIGAWMLNYVETYFFSYEYFKRYGVFPFGERVHGIIGLLDYYGEKLNETDLTKTYYLMRYIATKPYRGHFKCLCGSQKHLRDCHGKYVIAYYNNFDAYEFLKQDLSLIEYTLYKVRKGKE